MSVTMLMLNACLAALAFLATAKLLIFLVRDVRKLFSFELDGKSDVTPAFLKSLVVAGELIGIYCVISFMSGRLQAIVDELIAMVILLL